jgi:hypothetical protein
VVAPRAQPERQHLGVDDQLRAAQPRRRGRPPSPPSACPRPP